MTTISQAAVDNPRGISTLWRRKLNHFPSNAQRWGHLTIVVLSAVVLYYALYVQGSVATLIGREYQMSFRYIVNITVVGSILGAISSLLAGLADRWGRANLVAYGLGVCAVITLYCIPHAPTKFWFAFWFSALSFVEGFVLVATPALARDFSSQSKRGAAMGLWTLGPVIGSLIVSQVSSRTLPHLPAWQDQFTICGFVTLAVFGLALFRLRELSPALRDQLMVSERDRVLIEARARGVDVKAALHHPWKQIAKPDLILSSIAISLFLMIYYVAVGFFVVYFVTVYGFTEAQANGIGNWFWAMDAVGLVVVGVLSDRLRVRKPFMLIGAVGTMVATYVFLSKATQPATSRGDLILICSTLAFFCGVTYAPWMAAFTEAVEKRNPALTAYGLALWGWILRGVVAALIFTVPVIVTSVTPVVNHGPDVKAALDKVDPKLLATVQAHQPLFTELAKYPDASKIPPALLQRGISEVGIPTLQAAAKAKEPLAVLAKYGTEVQDAQIRAPKEFQHLWWVCLGGQLVFIPLTFLMAGEWSPRRAKRRADAHELALERELAALSAGQIPAPGGPVPSAAPAGQA